VRRAAEGPLVLSVYYREVQEEVSVR